MEKAELSYNLKQSNHTYTSHFRLNVSSLKLNKEFE
jgi:hypothetical protein